MDAEMGASPSALGALIQALVQDPLGPHVHGPQGGEASRVGQTQLRGSSYHQGTVAPAAAGPAQLGTSASLPWGKDSAVTPEKQKTNPSPFSSLAVPGRGTRGPAEWSDLEKVGRASEVEQQRWGRGSHAAIKERLPIKDPFSLSSGADTAPTSFCIHKASLGSAFKYC
ncbi:unnamed protein product [Rangifer tarandus platyrhynchus]|uniref:Uncharacterized protein n=2 Tax=Rangifer tarandus platyrhynchus TaxID=3082113 RepID=A0ACB0EZ74_RANTA|nr:unnamed protein product [Rangifer tarandus platyrhynchus]CAI9705286.1 unnamed protein product [Rangifer tarandus platyrhynchus]